MRDKGGRRWVGRQAERERCRWVGSEGRSWVRRQEEREDRRLGRRETGKRKRGRRETGIEREMERDGKGRRWGG